MIEHRNTNMWLVFDSEIEMEDQNFKNLINIYEKVAE